MLLISAVLVVAQAAGAPAPEEFRQDSRHGRRECVAVQVISPQQPRAQARPAFSATRILDLEFRTFLRRGLQGPHALELRVFTPKGHLYQVLTVPFTAPGHRPGKRQVDGYPQPLDEQEARLVRWEGVHRHQVSATLPVAGTSIMTNSLYGQWRVEPHLDGEPDPCGPPRSFAIGQ